MKQAKTVYEVERATVVAQQMQAAEDMGWTYTAEVVNAERGLAVIVVYDDEGFLVGTI